MAEEEKRPTIDELRGMVGKKECVEVVEVDKSMIWSFAEAIGDPNPLWRDEEYAKKTKYGGIVAPPHFLFIAWMSAGFAATKVLIPYPRGVAGGGEWEFYQHIKVGDVITTTHTFADLYERERKDGSKMAFLVFDSFHRNQRGELVAKTRSSIISY